MTAQPASRRGGPTGARRGAAVGDGAGANGSIGANGSTDERPEERGRRAQRGSPGQARGRGGRSAAEWASLGISIAIILGVVGLVLYEQLTRRDDPAMVEVRPDLAGVRHAGATYYLPLEIANTGGETAEDVTVAVELTPPGGEPEQAEVTIRFLAGGASQRATVAFQSDPAQGKLEAAARSFLDP
jgi:uncharacterized protein (TIGR02588 family)